MPDSSTLNALGIIARRFGLDVQADELRRHFMLVDDEPSSDKIASIGKEIGLEIRPLEMRWDQLLRIQRVVPAILRLRDGSSLILDSVRVEKGLGQIATVRDPLDPTGVLAAVDEERLGQVWTGEVLLVKRRYALTDEAQPFGMSWLVGQLVKERAIFRDIIIAAVINTLFVLVPPIVARVVLDKVMGGQAYATLNALTVFFFVAVLFEMIVIHLRALFLESISARIDGAINTYVLEKVLNLPMDYFEQNSTGYITHKLIHSVYHVRNFLTGQVFLSALDIITAIILVPILFIISWLLASAVMVWVAFICIIIAFFVRPLSRRHIRYIQAEHEKASYMTETLYGMRTIKSLALEGRRRIGWDVRVAEAMSARFALGRTSHYLVTWMAPFERLITSGSMLIGGIIYLYYVNLLNAGQSPNTGTVAVGEMASTVQAALASLQPGMLVAFSILASTAASPLLRVARLMLEAEEVRSAVHQVRSVVNTPPEETRSGTGLRLPIRGNIVFDDVRFRYSPGAALALDGVSFNIEPGTILGIMGRSGSGKTTITRLLQGLNATYEGLIKVDGMDLREIDLRYLRTNIGVVAQENFLFTGTIRENIGMARPDASLTDIIRAAQMSGAEEFIEKQPKGYDTLLEEGAVNLSGGQRQRLAIARALILDPPVLILDEATSALDAESEAIINANLMRIAEGRTIICVSHRLSMLVPSHNILVMEKGRLYDSGTHEELLHRCDIYRHMWYQQNRYTDSGVSHGPIAIAHSAAQ